MSDIPNTLNYMIAGFSVMVLVILGYIAWLWQRISYKIKQINKIQSESREREESTNDLFE